MRLLTLLGLLGFLASAACTDLPSPDAPESVRDRLASGQTELAITPAESTGAITAERRTPDGWVAGAVELTVERGALVLTADARGAIRIEHLALELGPISIPPGVLGYPAQLTDIHLEVDRPAGVVTTWTGDDDARATAQVALALTWSLAINGEASPLGAPRVPAVPVELALIGDGATVRAELHARLAGTFWSWANLVKLEDLTLSLIAATVAP